jgi:glutathione S-transferase
MELWHTWFCPECMRVRAALVEKGVPYRAREVAPGERLPELGRPGAGGVLPVLVDGASVVSGALPVLEYMSARWPEPPLFPPRVGRDAVVATYQRVDRLFAPLLEPIDRGSPEERVRALGEARRAMEELDGELVVGFLLAEFSVADLALASYLARLPRDWRPTQLGFERLARWERAVMQRPAVREQMGPRFALAG